MQLTNFVAGAAIVAVAAAKTEKNPVDPMVSTVTMTVPQKEWIAARAPPFYHPWKGPPGGRNPYHYTW